MDLGLPGDDDPRRSNVKEWLAAHPKPTGRLLAEAGYVVPHWPAPFGRDADPLTQLVIDDELRAAGVRRPVNPIGIGWAGPTLLYAGTAEQKERWLWPLLAGEEFWCQLFSEPGAGSDLAALRTTAARDGDHYVINGQKVWTSYAHIAQWGILLARTDPTATKHAGISYFVCPIRAPGIEVRALVDMTGEHAFNEVFFTDVRIPADHLVGAENGGWESAKVTWATSVYRCRGRARCGGWGRRRMISSSWSGASRPAWAGAGLRLAATARARLWSAATARARLWSIPWAWAWATLWSIPWAWAWATLWSIRPLRDRLVSVWMESGYCACCDCARSRPCWRGGRRGRKRRSAKPSPMPTASM